MTLKKDLSERDICTKYIIPALKNSGWDIERQVREEVYFTNGKIYIKGNKSKRGARKRADYILYYKPNIPVAIIEAKRNEKSIGFGIQQALEYSYILDIPVAYSSNGDGFLEHDRTAFLGKVEHELKLEDFPTPKELWEKYKKYKGITDKEQEKIVSYDYYYDRSGHQPRYYQQIAINRTTEAIAKGQKRILLVMATGTGKTFTAFHIIYRLWKNGIKKRILFLVDRNALIEQTKRDDFKPFKEKMTVIRKKQIDKAYEIYLALYQGLTNYNEDKDAYKEFSPDFFDLVIVDECHRGSAAADSAWREILEYFDSATQIGLTATPKETKEVSNIEYFGEPIYTYSLKQGINDGFLAPYKVIRVGINIDLEGWRPEVGKKDKNGNIVEDRIYNTKDFDRNLVIDERTALVAKRITEYLKRTDRFSKTIVFCVDIDHAERMRKALIDENNDLAKKNYKYIMRITGDEVIGRKELDNFINPEETYPVVATTSKLLTTGINAQTCKLIVLESNIQSMTEFKQIIGRGTRIREDFGKTFFAIIDFRNVTNLFADPSFDGEPVMIKELDGQKEITDKDMEEPEKVEDIFDGETGEKIDFNESLEPDGTYPKIIEGGTINDEDYPKKVYVSGVDVTILNERIQYLDDNGKLITGSLKEYTKSKLIKQFRTLDEFLTIWNGAERKNAIIEELEENNIILDQLKEEVEKDLDIFDLICHVAWDKKPLTRKERVENVRKKDYFVKYEQKARNVLNSLLDKYAQEGIKNIEDLSILKISPINNFGTPIEIIDLFGGKNKYLKAIKEMKKYIYEVA